VRPLLLGLLLFLALVPAAAAQFDGSYDSDDDWPGAGVEVPDPWNDDNADVPDVPALPLTSMKVVPGREAAMRTDGRAAIPHDAPKRVRQVIRMANQIVGKPYKWGGGHARLGDTGYDCSGAVSYALIKAGLQRTTKVSGALARSNAAGLGRYVTIFANASHVYMEIAGLRFDTSPYGDPEGSSGVRWRPVVGRREGFKARHPVGL